MRPLAIGVAIAAAIGLQAGCTITSAHPPRLGPGTTPVLWRNPATRESHRSPLAPFRFVREDRGGDSPKFDVIDAAGVPWRVKLGPEAHTEVAAGRLLAALGYFADTMQYLPTATIDGLKLTRGREFMVGPHAVRGARFEAHPDNARRAGRWDWVDNPFAGTEMLDGLRVVMVLINNYDARRANNEVVIAGGEARYVVSDLGASFGSYGGLGGGRRSKGDAEAFRRSRFIDRVANGRVRFAYRTRPEGWGLSMFVLNPFYTAGELKKQRDLRDVPSGSVRWIARRLAALDGQSIRHWFEEAGYEPGAAAGFAASLRQRIDALAAL